ncbi:hypothetical protein GCM10022409_29070 [Hymenobacter glaciei]|uniref:Bacterial transcriptional activator domain-containing protein n=1 Tax=Hymenobacter glaciei TaxID=877209 RepID=A0ABP7UDZ3_9BACT
MTRATLLHVLERPTALGPAEVRELEQLAQAFPYCQTAHLLLAKAAHDQGTMLAGQRLRRAATYAADRTLLRRLIEEVEPLPEPSSPLAPPHPLDLVDWPDEYVAPTASQSLAPITETPAATAPFELAVAPPLPQLPVEVPVAIAQPPVAVELPIVTPAPVAPQPPIAAVPEPIVLIEVVRPAVDVEAAPLVEFNSSAVEAVASVSDAHTEPVAASPTTEAPVVSEAAAHSAPEYQVLPAEVAVAISAPVLTPPVVEELTVALPAPIEVEAPTATQLSSELVVPEAAAAEEANVVAAVQMLAVTEASPATSAPVAVVPDTVAEAELPAQAPAIRPPAEVGEARFEFGLAEPVPVPAAPTYELPGLVDEWAASAVTLSLAGPKLRAQAVAAALAPVPVLTPAAFTGDTVVGYAFGESSRLGLSMQLLDLLTAKAETAESATAVVAAAQPPASALPPTGTFFEPDPLLLDHWATHKPAVPELPSTVDLINNFLKRQPRLTRAAMLPPAPGGQTDLSVRSTRAEPDLVSENLARIFVRQGKTARAIEIYEKLMVKQPEKMAYFAAQIQSLQPSA